MYCQEVFEKIFTAWVGPSKRVCAQNSDGRMADIAAIFPFLELFSISPL
jgi:hypothetical protein